MAKQPSYPMYAQDFDMDTSAWDNEAVGAYIRLLNCQWINGALPDDHRELARIARSTPKKFQKSWQKISKKFSRQDQNGIQILQNPKMERVREELNKYLKKQQESGRRGAEIRWGKDSDPNGEPIASPMANGCLSSSSSSSFEDIKNPPTPQETKPLNEPSPGVVVQAEIQKLRERYQDQQVVDQTLEAFKSTRKSFDMSPNLILAELKWWAKYPEDHVRSCMQVYLDGDHAAQSRAEKYLRGIIRNHLKAGKGRSAGPSPVETAWQSLMQAIRTAGQDGGGWRALDARTQAAAKAVGDWSWWCGRTERELHFKKGEFKEAWERGLPPGRAQAPGKG
jgi:uncharacterized protein YdaU (DUF1376 family)